MNDSKVGLTEPWLETFDRLLTAHWSHPTFFEPGTQIWMTSMEHNVDPLCRGCGHMAFAIEFKLLNSSINLNRKMRRFNWKTKSLSIAVVLLLVFVLNPEVRAILLVIDYLGVDLVLLLLSGYISRYWSVIAYYAHAALAFIGVRATHILRKLRWIGYGLHPREAQWAQVDHLGLVSGVIGRLALERFHR